MKHILVADDNVDQLEIVRLALSSTYRVTGSASLAAFEKALDAGAPDAVLLDLHLGAHHAGRFMESLIGRGMGGVPVILVSGAVDLAAQGRALGCVAVLEKPFRLTVLRELLPRVLNGTGGKA